MNNRLIPKTPFEIYFTQSIFTFSCTESVLRDSKRKINSQLSRANGLRITEMSDFIGHYSKEMTENQSGIHPTICAYFAEYEHQGSFADMTHTYYYIKSAEKGNIIPSSLTNEGTASKSYDYFSQQDTSVVYIEQFDIPWFSRKDDPEQAIAPTRPDVPIARLLTISLIKVTDDTVGHELLLHKVFVMDKETGPVLFDADDPNVEERYTQSIETVQDEINGLTLPFKLFGTLKQFNKQSIKQKITLPVFSINIDWKKINGCGPDGAFCTTDWLRFSKELSHINWEEFENDIVKNRFAAHQTVAKAVSKNAYEGHIKNIYNKNKQAPGKNNDLGFHVPEQQDVEALINFLIKFDLPYQIDEANTLHEQMEITKSVLNYIILQRARQEALKDFHALQKIIQDTLHKIVRPQVLNDLIQATHLLYLAIEPSLDGQQEGLKIAGRSVGDVIRRIKIDKDNTPIEDICNLIVLVEQTTLIVKNLTQREWNAEEAGMQLALYEEYKQKYMHGKYWSPATFAGKAALAVGGVALFAGATAVSAGAWTIPAMAGVFATNLGFFAVPVTAATVGVTATAVGSVGANNALKGEITMASGHVLQEAKKYHAQLQASERPDSEKKRAGWW
jgi:hypothetical protein